MPDSYKDRSPGGVTAAFRRKPLIAIAAGVAFFFSVYFWVSPRIGFVGYGRDCFYLQDYAYHIILTSHFWSQGFGNIYDLGFQLQAISAYMEKPAMAAMPVAVTPIALIVWMPFAYIARFSLSASYSLWVAVSAGILILALLKISAPLYPFPPHRRLPLVLCGITVFSLVGVSAVIVGQTSLYAGGILSLLIYRMTRLREKPEKTATDWLSVLLIVAAGLKPPYLIIGFGVLWIYGQWRELCCATALIMALAAALTPLLTPEWIRSYLRLLQMYSSGDFPDIYAWSIAPRTMNILRSAISGFTGDRIAAGISTVVSALMIAGIGICSRFRPLTHTAGPPRLTVALIACCLLFSPNSGAYEDILLIPAFVAVLAEGATPRLSTFRSAVIACALFLSLFHNVPGSSHHHLWIFFALKLGVLASMVYYAGLGRTGKNHFAGRNCFIRS
ncbi:MAG: hypothetical protein AB1724_16515 [Thermodesulfobacteriota bacterium]